MTRMRDNRSDWPTYSKRTRTETMRALGALYGGKCTMCDEPLARVRNGCDRDDCALRVRERKARAKPVQHEAAESDIVWERAWAEHWWAPGLRRIEHRTKDQRERMTREGVVSGMPDWWLLVPTAKDEVDSFGEREPVRAVCELKALPAPAETLPQEWWLGVESWRWTVDSSGDPVREAYITPAWKWQRTWHRVTASQLYELRQLHQCGFRTNVAYGADAALAFFDRVAGPKPDVLPEGWE